MTIKFAPVTDFADKFAKEQAIYEELKFKIKETNKNLSSIKTHIMTEVASISNPILSKIIPEFIQISRHSWHHKITLVKTIKYLIPIRYTIKGFEVKLKGSNRETILLDYWNGKYAGNTNPLFKYKDQFKEACEEISQQLGFQFVIPCKEKKI